jgi:peptidoglycan hydrolase-like protein with peptidoglycan-binding domain
MKRKLFVTALFFLTLCCPARADQIIESVQQKLKDQGFYYGEINGKKDTDTTAAIRRYQIRNGLQITGEINAETQRSLGLGSKPAATPPPQPANSATLSRRRADRVSKVPGSLRERLLRPRPHRSNAT